MPRLFSLAWRVCFTAVLFATLGLAEECDPHGPIHDRPYHRNTPTLTLRPTPHGSVVAHYTAGFFHSDTHALLSHSGTAPRALAGLGAGAGIVSFSLSLSRGRWRTNTGDPPCHFAAPLQADPEGACPAAVSGPGITLTVVVRGGSEKRALSALGAVFCASLGRALDTGAAHVIRGGAESTVRVRLPSEAVCTENLSPFLRTTPCRGTAGLASLLDPERVFESRSLHLSIQARFASSPGKAPRGALLDYRTAATAEFDDVFDPAAGRGEPGAAWDLATVFGARAAGAGVDACASCNQCGGAPDGGDRRRGDQGQYQHYDPAPTDEERGAIEAAAREGGMSVVALDLPPADLWPAEVRVEGGAALPVPRCQFPPSSYANGTVRVFSAGARFNLTVAHGRALEEGKAGADAGAAGPQRHVMPSPRARGVTFVRSSTADALGSFGELQWIVGAPEEGAGVTGILYDTVPWFLRLQTHTLRVAVDGVEDERYLTDPGNQARVIPGAAERRPSVLSLPVNLAAGQKLRVTVRFEKLFLKWTAYPPDPHGGYPLGSSELWLSDGAVVHSNALAVALPLPDFSMPYNVMILTCTVFALMFGQAMNVLMRRIDRVDISPAKE